MLQAGGQAAQPAMAPFTPAWGTRNGRSSSPGAKRPSNLVRFARGGGTRRLSASRRAGLPWAPWRSTRCRVLNASRHHGERDILRPRRMRRELRVLNASRHHGERDPGPVPDAQGGAGVLNASRHHGERDAESAFRHHHEQVLNASRHHGKRDRYRAPHYQLRQCVLNASRHHGERDSWAPSTPVRASCVLNAFRHHGERDVSAHELRSENLVLNAFQHHGERDVSSKRSSPSLLRDQRLSASRRAGPPRPAARRGWLRGAQRLSASRREGR